MENAERLLKYSVCQFKGKYTDNASPETDEVQICPLTESGKENDKIQKKEKSQSQTAING